MAVAEALTQHGAVLGLRQAVVVGMARARFGEIDAELLQQTGDPVIEVLRMQLARELSEQGHAISHVSVGALLKDMGYSLQGNRKTLEGASHPDRNARFKYIDDKTQAALGARCALKSTMLDTKRESS